MNNDLYAQVKNLSLELRSLIRQGVKEGVAERIERRNQLLEEWFNGVKELIQLTNEQQQFLENLLVEEQELLSDLQQEQQELAQQQRQQRNVSKYLQ